MNFYKTPFGQFLFSSLLVFTSTTALAADPDSAKNWDQLLKTFKTETITVRWIKPALYPNMIKHLDVLDVRPDTMHLGMFSSQFQGPMKVVFPESVTLATLMCQKLSDPNNDGSSVLMVIRDLWMSNVKPIRVADENNPPHTLIHASKIVFQVDLFLKNSDQYYPLARIDTILWANKTLSTSSGDLFEKALETIHLKFSTALTEAKYAGRRKEDKQTIVNFYASNAAQTPTEQQLKAGIYTSYEDFKKNEVVQENFRIRTNKTAPSTLVIVDGQGNETLERKVWGVCDGKDQYIMDNGMLFRLYKNGSAYYWIGMKEYDQRTFGAPAAVPLGGGWAAVGLEAVGSSVRIKLSPKLLNLKTGKEY